MNSTDKLIESMLLTEARKGVWGLGIVAVVQVITTLVIMPDSVVLWAVAGIFAALAVWASKAPLIASSVGLGVFVLMHGFEAFVEPASLTRGILMKVIVIGLLAAAIKGGLKHREFLQKRGTG